ncbi:MAG: SUMF1/EgtB/PvdO family nonheme iron enzyme, partial [bacterium]|nr:SUMF1/EgtB/PvdO family nonheme iron enzyme [bacterium]
GNDLPTMDRLNFDRLIGHSVDVGSRPDGATEFGIHDLAGNVWEWVHDRYGESYYSSSAGTNPKGPETGDERVRRGGSWADTEDLVRPANRNRARPANSFGDVGFRCARTPDGVTDPPRSFTLSGRITADGAGIGDIRVRLTGDMDATMSTIVSSGTFSFDLPDGSYTITPEKEGFAFIPESRTVIISGENITGADFNGMRTTSPPDTLDSSLPGAGEYEWVLIPAGSFPMGSEAGDIWERPVHRVNLKSYEIGKYEVTNVQYLAFLVAKRETSDRDGNDYLNLGVKNLQIQQMDTSFSLKNSAFATHPVVEVTWYVAKAFCEWISGRLPTEAEWEKAARGTDERIYPWGGELDGRRANYQNSGDPYDNSTAPVGYFDGSLRDGYQTLDGASPYGLYDVAGNVYEWVQDWYGEDYYSKSPENNPFGPETGESKVNRGGSYDYHPFIIRSSHRSWYKPHVADDRQGFRCAKSVQ